MVTQLPKFCVGGIFSSGTARCAAGMRGLSPRTVVTNSIVPNNRPYSESRVSYGAGVKNAGSFRRFVQHRVHKQREGRREIVGTRRGRNAAARGNEKSDDERALLFVSSSHIFDCRSCNRFVTRAYVAVLTFFFLLFLCGSIKGDITRFIVCSWMCLSCIRNPVSEKPQSSMRIQSFLSDLTFCISFVAATKLWILKLCTLFFWRAFS